MNLEGKQGKTWVCVGRRPVNTTGSGKPGWSVAHHVPAMGVVVALMRRRVDPVSTQQPCTTNLADRLL